MSSLQQDYDYTFKIAITGNSGVGKSSLMMRFTDDIFSESLIPTVGVDFKIRSLESLGKVVKLNIWDTAGQERFDTIIQAYYRGIHACLIVFDLTDRQSFVDVTRWHDKCLASARSEVRCVLIGNKSDMESHRVVSEQEAQDLADELGMTYLETSAKTKSNIDKCFISLSEQLIKQIKPVSVINTDKLNKDKNMFKVGGKAIKDKSSSKQSTCC